MRGSLTARAAAAVALLAVLIIGGFLLVIDGIQRLDSAQTSSDRALAVVSAGSTLENTVLDMQSGVRGFVDTGDRAGLQDFRKAVTDYPGQARTLGLLTRAQPALHAQVAAISAAIAGYVRGWATPVTRLGQSNRAAAERALAAGTGRRLVNGIRQRLTRLNRAQLTMQAGQWARARHTATVTLVLGGAGLAACLLVLAGFVVSAQLAIGRPVRRLQGAARRVREGDLAARVPAGGIREVAELGAAFNAMAEELEAVRNEVEQQNAELQGQQAELASALTEVEQQRERAEGAHRFATELAAQSGMEVIAGLALREIADRAHAEVGALYLLDERSGLITLRANRGARAGDFAAEFTASAGLAGRAVTEQRPVTISYPGTSLRLPGLIGDREVRHELHLPLLQRGRAIGVLSLGRSRDTEFTPRETETLAEFAQTASLACAEAMVLRRMEGLAGELQVVMDSTDEGIYRRDLAGRITYINRAVLEQTGYTAGELLGRDAHHLLHRTHLDGTDYPAAECPFQQVIDDRAGAQFSGEVFWRKDSTPFPIDCSAYPFFDGDQVTGIVVTFRDISERKMADSQLAAQYQAARVLAEAGSLGEVLPRLLAIYCEQLGWRVCAVWAMDDDGDLLRCQTAVGRPGTEEQVSLLDHATLAAGHGTVGRAWQEGEPVHEIGPAGRSSAGPDGATDGELAVPFRRNGQVVRVVQLLGPALLVTDGMITTIQTIGAQVAQFTERKETEAAAALMKDQFVATVSHELRTPLAAMDGWLHILLEGEPGPLTDDQRRFLGTVKRNSDRLMRLVGDLLLIGQMDAGRFSLDLGEVDIAELVGETVALFSGPASEKGIELTASSGPTATVHGDRLRLGQLLSNLVSNAIKFTPENGTVQLRVTGRGERCLIEVTDSGVGIPAGERAHLFERFYRASTAAGTAGTGLGLAISKAIAEGHGGTIRVADAEAGGTRFVVELPVTARAEATL